MNDVQIGVMVVIIIALCQGFKMAGVNTRYIPLIAIALGILGAVYIGGINWMAGLAGVIVALISSGLYSSFKKTVLNK